MSELNKFEGIASDAELIAKDEMELGKKLKIIAKLELKKAKFTLNLAKSRVGVAKARENSAEVFRKIAETMRKSQSNGLIDADPVDLKKDEEFAIYNEKVAENIKNVAEINKKIIAVEEEIVKIMVKKLANQTIKIAKIRKSYASNLRKYIKLYRTEAPVEKLKKAENAFQNDNISLIKERKDLIDLKDKIQKKHNEIADLNSDIAKKISERDKIRHPITI